MKKVFLQIGFRKRAPWISSFVIGRRNYGGSYDVRKDCRLQWFNEHFYSAKTILDLGSLEGAQSFYLAENPSVTKITGLEGRTKNIEKANFIKRVRSIDNVEFFQIDLEEGDLKKFGKFEVVLCAGILYHLQKPWNLIKKISEISDNVFIWTHYASVDKANKVINGYRGMIYNELGIQDPQSGLATTSFWLTLDSLGLMINDNGFDHLEVIENNPNTVHGPVVTMIAKKEKLNR